MVARFELLTSQSMAQHIRPLGHPQPRILPKYLYALMKTCNESKNVNILMYCSSTVCGKERDRAFVLNGVHIQNEKIDVNYCPSIGKMSQFFKLQFFLLTYKSIILQIFSLNCSYCAFTMFISNFVLKSILDKCFQAALISAESTQPVALKLLLRP